MMLEPNTSIHCLRRWIFKRLIDLLHIETGIHKPVLANQINQIDGAERRRFMPCNPRAAKARSMTSMDSGTPMEPLLRAEEVMHLLGVSRSWFERLMATGNGPACVRVGRLRRWRRQDVQRWIDSQIHEELTASRGG